MDAKNQEISSVIRPKKVLQYIAAERWMEQYILAKKAEIADAY